MTFISGVLIARVLGPEARGEYGSVLMVAQTAAAIGTFSFFDGAIVILRRNGTSALTMMPTMFAAAFALAAFSAGASMLILPWLNLGLHKLSVAMFLVFTVLIIFTYLIITTFLATERARMRFSLINASRVTAPAAFSLLIVAAWLFGDGSLTVPLVLVLFLVSKLPETAWFSVHFRAVAGRMDPYFARDAFLTGLRLHFAVVLILVATQLDRFFAIGTWPKELLGQYFVAFSAVGAGYSVVTTSMNTVLLPYLSGIPHDERAHRIGQTIRLTLLATTLAVLVGVVTLPVAIKLLYGAEYTPARGLALGLLFALSPLPLRAIVLEAGRSLGQGQPSVEMALTSLAAMLAGYIVTGFATPAAMITTLGLSNLAATLSGARHMLRNGDIRLDRSLLPGKEDIRVILSLLHLGQGGSHS